MDIANLTQAELDSSKAVPETTIFSDLGGGTFDISAMDLDIANGIVEVRSTSGDCFLGGNDFSAFLAEDITKDTIETVEAKITTLQKTMQRINDKAEITINMPYITQDHAKHDHISYRILLNFLSRSKLYHITIIFYGILLTD